ncbi:MAG: universal stress protein [Thermoleophilia bacterium]|nr:universal stress protein [Thermoleophilia bacterium]
MRVLVGFDGSAGARDAIELTRVFCSTEGDEALLVNVLPYGGPLPVAYSLLGYEDSVEVREFFTDARVALAGIAVETRTYTGDSAAHVITDLAEAADMDLVVVGSPHRGAVGRTLIGSVAESLLHGASTPIAVAPHGYAARGGLEVVAIAYDGSAESKLALKHAEALAGSVNAKLRVLTVVSPAVPVPGVVAYTPPIGFDAGELIEEAVAAVDSGVETEGRRLAGPPSSALSKACADGVDLLVAGSRGYGPLGRAFVGSVTSRLICKSPCPVLVIPRSMARAGSSSEAQSRDRDAEQAVEPKQIGKR